MAAFVNHNLWKDCMKRHQNIIDRREKAGRDQKKWPPIHPCCDPRFVPVQLKPQPCSEPKFLIRTEAPNPHGYSANVVISPTVVIQAPGNIGDTNIPKTCREGLPPIWHRC